MLSRLICTALRAKDYDYDQMLNLLLKAGDTNIAEVYSDGWADMPDTMESLILDVPKYSHVYLLTLEGVSESDHLGPKRGAKLRCLLFHWLGGLHRQLREL